VVALAMAALPLTVAGARAASFDCRAATTQVKRTICADSRLSEGEERLAFAYRALQSAARPDDVRAKVGATVSEHANVPVKGQRRLGTKLDFKHGSGRDGPWRRWERDNATLVVICRGGPEPGFRLRP
jgi:hypothetical protein